MSDVEIVVQRGRIVYRSVTVPDTHEIGIITSGFVLCLARGAIIIHQNKIRSGSVNQRHFYPDVAVSRSIRQLHMVIKNSCSIVVHETDFSQIHIGVVVSICLRELDENWEIRQVFPLS